MKLLLITAVAEFENEVKQILNKDSKYSWQISFKYFHNYYVF